MNTAKIPKTTNNTPRHGDGVTVIPTVRTPSAEQIAALSARLKNTDRLLTLNQIQDTAGVSRPTLYRWRHEYGLKVVRVGRCVRVRESDWLAWLAKNTVSERIESTAVPEDLDRAYYVAKVRKFVDPKPKRSSREGLKHSSATVV